MKIKNQISELIEAEVISTDVATNIEAYYASKATDKDSRLFLIFGVIGAVLVGLGLILIMAHNWDEMTVWLKVGIAFTPLVLGQLLCVFSIFYKSNSAAWKQSSAMFLFLSIGGCISLISQIYNIPGEITSFIFVWMILALPIIYMMPSSIVSLMYLYGTGYYATQSGTWSEYADVNYKFWILLGLVLPYYLYISRSYKNKLLTIFHHWAIPVVLAVGLLMALSSLDPLLSIVFISLFGIYYMIGHIDYFRENALRANAYLVYGSLSTVIFLFVASFTDFWKHITRDNFFVTDGIFSSLEGLVVIITVLIACVLMSYLMSKRRYQDYKPIFFAYFMFVILYLLDIGPFASGIIVNVFLLIIGLTTVKEGVDRNHVGISVRLKIKIAIFRF